ncbi:T6SS phospholipase effector Tle1-like catalytic domain-containing protein [Sinomicrobium sp. M5D2P9]
MVNSNSGIIVTAQQTGAQNQESIQVLSGVDVQTSTVYVGKADYEEHLPEDVVNVTIGVFFDGTMNNRKNVNSRLEHEKAERNESHRADIAGMYREEEGSYENDHSNVSRMEPFYESIDDENLKQYALYIEGIGTEDYEGDSTKIGGGLGQGPTGVKAKVAKGCEKVAEVIVQGGINKINILTVDVFGFSRGAAAARHFIHEIHHRKGDLKSVSPPVGPGGMPHYVYYEVDKGILGEHFQRNEIKVKILQVRFAGLYDTVASHGIIHHDDTQELGLDAVRRVRYTLQLAAADEHRNNFRLTNINSTGGKGLEKFLPGVHADVGGCYTDNFDEDIRLNYTFTSIPELREERQHLIDEGWFLPHEITVNEFWGTLRGLRKRLSNKYSFIPLHIMIEYAMEKRLNFDFNAMDEEYPIISQLIHVKERLDNYVKGEAPEMIYENPGDHEVLKVLRNRYLHFSAHYSGIGMGPNRENGVRKRVIQNG